MAVPHRPPGPRGFLTDEEKESNPKVTKGLLLRILSYLKPYWLQFILVFISILLSSVVGLLPSIITGRIVDEALIGKNMDLLLTLLAAAFATLVVSQIIGILESYISAWISQKIIFDMKNQMYDHLQHMSHAFFSTEKQGDIFTRMNNDIGGVSSVVSGTLTSIVSNITIVVTTMIALFSMNWKLALVGIVVIPILMLSTKEVGRTRWRLLTESQEKSDEMNQIINETLSISGSMLVKLFTREKKEYARFVEVNEELTQIAMKEQRSGKWFRVMMGIFMQIGPLLIYFAGGYLIISRADTTLTVGVITATVSLINRLYRPIQLLLNLKVDFIRSLALFSRIFDYFDRKNEIVSKPDAVKPDVTNAKISFRQVNFSYTPGSPILKNISFSVPSGSLYAIVGPSGSGKSSIVGLIPRLYDVDSGQVAISGVDVRDFDLTYLRECIGVVTQDTYLFNGTIKENLLYAKDDASDKEIETACRIANLHEFIMNQPSQYGTIVGNRGLKLSGGEKQRLSIARVILKNPKILVLDEATSSLDSVSESLIQTALDVLMKGRTSIVIAHRLSTVLAADWILVVKEGRIVEQGEHDDLLKYDGIYKELYETQFRKVLEHESSIDKHTVK
ncbi:MAG: ABC transporter ATP-binding protein [Eubacteriaceae bacterium]|nr:ABC transporter ATP-binding protein [Eubacteriaceae bacterium]